MTQGISTSHTWEWGGLSTLYPSKQLDNLNFFYLRDEATLHVLTIFSTVADPKFTQESVNVLKSMWMMASLK